MSEIGGVAMSSYPSELIQAWVDCVETVKKAFQSHHGSIGTGLAG